jgi:hypothetical protein
MLQDSTLHGFAVDSLHECLVTTLFTNDMTVYLLDNDTFDTLQTILQHWYCTTGTKFNVQKTVLIPIGAKPYHDAIILTCQLHTDQPAIPAGVHIAAEGNPVHALGAFIGNGVLETTVWTPTLEAIDATLSQWNKSHPPMKAATS